MTGKPWREGLAEQVKALWLAGASAGAIARELGVSRNAVIGKIHRAGFNTLPRAAVHAHARKSYVSTEDGYALPPVSVNPVPVAAPILEPPLRLEDGNFATVLTISDRMCRWPIGDPLQEDFHFCGRVPRSGSPYCEAHARTAYQPKRDRERGAA